MSVGTAVTTPPIFAELVGQDDAVATLSQAVGSAAALVRGEASEAGMTHAWLFTGPPGSGRSVAARIFAAALQCPAGGCGECQACHTTLTGTHADVRFVVPEGLSIAVGEMRSLVLRAASSPTQGRWQILLVEDADRLTETAGNALLKAIEEPPPRTVFLLCTPSTHPDDISVTIRSRCRVVSLRQPPAEAIAALLHRRDGIDERTAAWAAAAAQGHVGRARRLARDPQARSRREAVLAVPRRLTGIGAAFDAASALIEAAEAEAAASVVDSDAKERAALETALGAGAPARAPPGPREAPRGSSRTSNAGSGPGPPGPSATPSTAPSSTSPASTATCWSTPSAPRSNPSTATPTSWRAPPRRNGPRRAPCAGSSRSWSAVSRSRPTSSPASPSRP